VKLLLFLARSSRWLLGLALATSLISGFVGASLVALINQALNEPPEQLATLGWKFAGLSLVVLFSRWLSQTQFVELSQRTLAQLRSQLTSHLAELPYRELERRGSAKLLAVLSEDVHAVSHLFVMLPELVMHGAVVLGCLIYLGVLSWQVFVFAASIVLLGSLGYHVADVRALGALRRAREHEDDLFRHFRALFDGAKELKLHRERRQAFIGKVLSGTIGEVRRARSRGLYIYAAAMSFGSFLFFVLIGSVLFGLRKVFPVDASVMSGYALMFLYMMLPLEGVLGAIPSIDAARVALERIEEAGANLGHEVLGETRSCSEEPRRVSPNVEEVPSAECPIGPGSTRPSKRSGGGEPGTNLGHEVLVGETRSCSEEPRRVSTRVEAAPDETRDPSSSAPMLLELPPFQRLELEGVTHRYHRETSDDVFTLGPVDLALRAGAVTFLIGGNGSGKTTLAKIVTGLYAAEGGRVLLNGQPVTDHEREAYRQLFSAVFSDFFLFDSLLGIERLRRDQRANELLVALELDHKLSIRDGMFSTTSLSHGQRKRLALLVAYLEDRPVYVFDEWAADQDPAYKEIFYRTLLPELKARGKAVLVITHDDRYFGLADHCVKLESGRLVAPASKELGPLRGRPLVVSI
jgi:putative ATP-binding cassette transporter